MSHEVYAGKWEIAGESGMNKSIARFPDVCLSPPSPPAGPIPVPYPDTSFSSDLKKGSKTVKLGGKPAALAQQSYYKPSVLGDEAATRTFGANIITHQITGKTYFQAWSMDVKFEGKNVCRHFDITTSNHASGGFTTVPVVAIEAALLAEIRAGICPCCKKKLHAGQIGGEPVPEEEWYDLNEKIDDDPLEPPAVFVRDGQAFANPAHEKWKKKCAPLRKRRRALSNRRGWVAEMKRCPTAPKSPCNVYFKITSENKDLIEEEWDANQAEIKEGMKMPLVKATEKDKRTGRMILKRGQVDHRVPKTAGGCPTGIGNLQNHAAMSKRCQNADKKLGDVQSQCAAKWDKEIKAGL
jgi:hypothetical protein